MAEITPDIVEYATVERLRNMLKTVKEDYKVTECYALFTALLCWVMQRIRTDDDHGVHDLLARAVRSELEASGIEEEPWAMKPALERARGGHVELNDLGKFGEITAFEFLLALRNAVAHGDAGEICPVNEDRILVGHSFQCSRPGKLQIESIVLYRRDMQRIGCALADLYCGAMRQAHAGEHLEEKAGWIKEGEAA